MSPVGVTLAVSGAPAPLDTLAQDLRREVVDVAVAPVAALLAATSVERSVVLLWFGGSIDAALCARAVAWAEDRRPRVGLIACAPDGIQADAEAALAAGFDDAIVGRSSPREIAARIRAVHRRVHWRGVARPGRIRHKGLVLDTDTHVLWIDGRAIALTATEMSVVRALMRAGGRTLSRSDLLDGAWGSANFDISERAVDNVILRLRRKIGAPDIIRTVRGVGFRLTVDS